MSKKKILIVSSFEDEGLLSDDLLKNGFDVSFVQIFAEDKFNFDISPLLDFDKQEHNVIISHDSRGLNMSRAKLYFDIRVAGYKIHSFISSSVHMPSNVKCGDGCLVEPLSLIGPGCVIGANVRIGHRVTIGRSVKIGKHVLISHGAVIGDNVSIGDNVHIGPGAVVETGTSIGRFSDLTLRQIYSGQIAEMSFYWWPSIGPSRVFDFAV